MNHNQNGKDPLYSDGFVKLRTLRALYAEMPDAHKPLHQELPILKEPSSQTWLIEKGRNRALSEYSEHEAKTQAFRMLSDRYRELGLNEVADRYKERADTENATTRGFQSVVKAYEKRLEDGMQLREEPAGDLERAGQYLESYGSDRKAFEDHTLAVLDHPSTDQDRSMRMAEYAAINAAQSYRGFQKEIQAAEKNYEALSQSNQTELDRTGTDDRSSNPSRMNKLAVGVVVYQTLKVLDHEL